MGFTTIQVTDEIKEKLRGLGKKGESYNEIVSKLVKFYKENKK